MSEDTPAPVVEPETKSADVVTGGDELFLQHTGISRRQATRTTAALLGVLGASFTEGSTPSQMLTAAVNVVGMVASEIIAGTGGTAEQRAELIASLNKFITKNADELAKEYQQAAQFAKFLEETTKDKQTLAPGVKAH